MEFLKFLGKNTEKSFYARDFRNNYRFRPDVNPPRIKFEGYVNFVFNRELASFLDIENHTFKTNISSLVRRAKLPQVQFKNIVKNQYNKKKVVMTGVEYSPIEITVFDTLNNEWLQILMRYFSYLFMNPRNRNADGDRDIVMNTDARAETPGSKFGGSSFKSGEAGLNLQRTKQFFERIDIILYHGKKGVQYSMTSPLINSFDFGDMDYASNEFVEFTIACDYENFTTFDVANFDLGGVDLDRFEKVVGLPFSSDQVLTKPLGIIDDGIDMEFLGNKDNYFGTRGRTAQPQVAPIEDTGDLGPDGKPLPEYTPTEEESTVIDLQGNVVKGKKPTKATYDAIDVPVTPDPTEKPGKNLLNTAILAKLAGEDVGDAVKDYVLTGLTEAGIKAMANVTTAPTRGGEEES